MGLFTHKSDEPVQAVDPRHQHEYKAPVSTWRIGCEVCGQMPDDARHVVVKRPEAQEVESEFHWPS